MVAQDRVDRRVEPAGPIDVAHPVELGTHPKRPEQPEELDGVPFLIRHANTGAEWGPAALAERQAHVHPIGSSVVLARLDIATSDPQDLAARYARELGLEFWAVVDLAGF